MAIGQLKSVTHYLGRLLHERAMAEQHDGQLLERFHAHHESEAFAAILRRHGPMVLSVCRRILGDVHDAEDAFQATFLVLVRKAHSIRNRRSLGSWLHGVAHRISLRARTQDRMRRMLALESSDEPLSTDPDTVATRDLRRLLDEELAQLPDHYRQPLVLCYLEGKTNEEAARTLGWTKGTVSGRLARARDLLRSRLLKRGLVVTTGTLAMPLMELSAQATVPVTLHLTTLRVAMLFAAGDIAAAGGVATLSEGVIQAMTLAKLKMTAAILLVAAIVTAGAGVLGYQAVAQTPEAGESETSTVADGWTANPVRVLEGHGADVTALAVAPDGRRFASGGTDNKICMWDLEGGKPVVTFDGQCAVLDLVFSPDGSKLASASGDNTLHVWDLTLKRNVLKIPHPTGPASTVAFSPDGQWVASLAANAQKQNWMQMSHAGTGQTLWTCTAAGPAIRAAAFSPDGKVLVTAESGGTIRRWDAATGNELQTRRVSIQLRDATVSKDVTIIAAADDRNIFLVDVSTGLTLSTTRLPAVPVKALTFSPDGRTLAVASGQGSICLFSVPDGKLIRTLQAGKDAILSLQFTPDGKRIVSGGADRSIRVWETDVSRRPDAKSPWKTDVMELPLPSRIRGLVEELAKTNRSDDQVVEALCLATLARYPTDTERRLMAEALLRQKDRRQDAITDLARSLLGTGEFQSHLGDMKVWEWSKWHGRKLDNSKTTR